jgi:hypothetical protein
VSVGGHPAAAAGSGSRDRVPVFVVRDSVPEVCEPLLRERFVLLVGESAAGKSRAAYEVIRELFPDRHLAVPAGRDGLGICQPERGTVGWLLLSDALLLLRRVDP